VLPTLAELLGTTPGKSALYDFEQAIHVNVAQKLMDDAINGRLAVESIVTERFIRDLHRELYGEIWTWAGAFRRHEINLGVAPEQILTETASGLDTLLYRWRNTADWNSRPFGIGVHAEILRIHPFADGNGRTSCLMADLVFLSTQDTDSLYLYEWRIDKPRYISLLREYDRHRNPRFLAEFIPIRSLVDKAPGTSLRQHTRALYRLSAKTSTAKLLIAP
jgi:fido (protein-threonine AMPylation protein)